MKLNQIIKETDIRKLVYAPPVLAFIGFLMGVFIVKLLTGGPLYPPVRNILMGILSFFLCFSGYSQIYKKEMPGALGGIYKGHWAVVSGMLNIIVFGTLGAITLIYGVIDLLN